MTLIYMRIELERLEQFLALGWNEVASGRGVFALDRVDVLIEHDADSPPFPCVVCGEAITEQDYVAFGRRSRACWARSFGQEASS